MTRIRSVALAYSGGLDTSIIIPWLREAYGCEVVAVVVDVGQREDFDAIAAKARASGAAAVEVVDAVDAFAEEFLVPALRAGALYEGRYLLGTALARPLIARAQIQVARAYNCDALAHGCTGRGNDQVRFELAYRTLAPDLRVLAPWREWTIRSRADALAYAEARGIPVPVTRERRYSMDQNLWHTSYEGGVLEDPAAPAPADMFRTTVDPTHAPDTPAEMTIRFDAGRPVALDGQALPAAELIRRLNALAGAHGVGRVDLVENRLVGMKSRGVYETPAGTVLHLALRDLEALTLERDTLRFHALVGARYADLVYNGQWFSPLRQALDAFVEASHAVVTGEVTLRLYKGTAAVVARSSPHSLYRPELATFEEGTVDHRDSAGFVRLWGLPAQVYAAVHPELRATWLAGATAPVP